MRTWDTLSKSFYEYADEDNLGNHVTDNILTAWPVIIKLIKKHIPNKQGKKALDFGCGSGGFCKKLDNLGFDVTGIDISKKMIDSARKNLPEDVTLITGDSSSLKSQNQFDLITSIQVFQFIENIEKTFKNLNNHLNENGLIIFAVFNPKFVKKHNFFKPVDDGVSRLFIPDVMDMTVYIRNSKNYEDILSKIGYKKISEQYPDFTDDLLKNYDIGLTKEDKEFMILAFQKVSNPK